MGVDKILASTKTWRHPYCQARQNLQLLTSPRPAEGLPFLPNGVDLCACSCQVRHWLQLPCFYGQTLSRTVLAYCTGLPCWKCPKLWRRQNISVLLDKKKFRTMCEEHCLSSVNHVILSKTWFFCHVFCEHLREILLEKYILEDFSSCFIFDWKDH